ncbi:MAG: hypothetical protein IKE33_01550 [Erysipelotrichaceae bacterium]|nr:hypothetical protein [Erysipelotrichaceae bacterium]
MNEKDLRVRKTKKAIKDTFLEAKKEKALEDITVRSICDKAGINPSTFYNHYVDIYELSDKLENELIKKRLDTITHFDSLLSNTKLFVKDIRESQKIDVEEFRILFKDRMNIYRHKIIVEVQKRCFETTDNEKERAKIIFCIGGMVNMFLNVANSDVVEKSHVPSYVDDFVAQINKS